MTELKNDPAIIALLEYAKAKKSISYDELGDFLPEATMGTDKIDGVLALLEANNIQIELDEMQVVDETEARKEDAAKKRLVFNEKDSAVDDPIRLYLREIGKENLLTAEQEVELSKQMENGENIIKDIIRESGVIIPEFYGIAQRALSKRTRENSTFLKKK